jgi:hypothetical protein
MTVPEGASLADTKKRLVLRTFAATSGDAARTAKMVGISVDEVRAEISSLIRGNGDMHPVEVRPDAVPAGEAARSRGAAVKAKSKKR